MALGVGVLLSLGIGTSASASSPEPIPLARYSVVNQTTGEEISASIGLRLPPGTVVEARYTLASHAIPGSFATYHARLLPGGTEILGLEVSSQFVSLTYTIPELPNGDYSVAIETDQTATLPAYHLGGFSWVVRNADIQLLDPWDYPETLRPDSCGGDIAAEPVPGETALQPEESVLTAPTPPVASAPAPAEFTPVAAEAPPGASDAETRESVPAETSWLWAVLVALVAIGIVGLIVVLVVARVRREASYRRLARQHD